MIDQPGSPWPWAYDRTKEPAEAAELEERIRRAKAVQQIPRISQEDWDNFRRQHPDHTVEGYSLS
jgi:hypothetical protein